MPFKKPRPLETWSAREATDFQRELWDRKKFNSFSWTPPLVGANSSVSFVVAASGGDVTSQAAVGLKVGTPVTVSPPDVLPSQVSVYALVKVADTLTVVIVNPTAAPVTPPAGAWSFHGMNL